MEQMLHPSSKPSPIPESEGTGNFDSYSGGLGLNPLNIPSIVRNVLEHVTFQALINSRSVCRLWAEEATRLLGKGCNISIHPYINLDDFIDLVKVHSASTIMPWNASARRHYNGVVMSPKLSLGSVKEFNIKLNTNLGGGKLIDKLFKLIGNKIRSTEISIDIGCSSSIWKIFHRHANQLSSITLTDALNQQRPGRSISFLVHGEFFISGEIVLPTVKKLCLVQTTGLMDSGIHPVVVADADNNDHNDDDDDDNVQAPPLPAQLIYQDASSMIQTLAILLLNLFPNLEILRIRNPRNDYSVIPTLLCEVSSRVDFKNPSPSIKSLSFPLNLNETEVKVMHEQFNWPLERLQLSLRPGLRFPALYSWLSSLGTTLTFLDMDFVLIPLNPETFSCGFDLVNMKTLRLKNYHGSLDFLPCMKNLHALSLTNVNLSVAFREEPERSCVAMKSLEIISGHSNAGRMSFAHIYKNITKYFPRLVKFRGDYLSDSNLKIVIKQCPLIEELLLADSVITDVGITGIPYSRCHELQSMLDHNYENLDGAITNENDVKEPCIADLKGLKKLHINSPRISNVSILYGLTNCDNLHELCMSSPLITSPVLIDFVKKVNLKKLRLFLSRSYRISSKDVAVLLLPEDQDQPNPGFSYPTVILDGKCNACGVSETD